jgi:hypothetical protein
MHAVTLPRIKTQNVRGARSPRETGADVQFIAVTNRHLEYRKSAAIVGAGLIGRAVQ